jgi:hypothetical protein
MLFRKASMRVLVAISLMSFALAVSACGSSTPVTSASTTVTTDILSGTVAAAVNGVPQTSTNNFTVGQGGGTVSITLTSAVETFPGGTTSATVTMGLGVGTASGTTCTLIAGSAPQIAPAGGVGISGTLSAGTYCVLVSDVTIQQGPVAYAVVVQHP